MSNAAPPPNRGLVELAHEPAFTLGPLKVRPATLEVVTASERQVLEPRVMQVFTVLARHRGEVVSRDELVATCWSGRFVGEDAINRAVARLRQVLRLADGAVRLETIPRVGYRIEVERAEKIGAGDAPTSTRPRIGGDWIGVAAVAMVLAITGLGLGLLLKRTPQYTATAIGPAVATPTMERHPRISPDGKMMAYAAGNPQERDIFLRSLAGGESIRLTDEPGSESGESWSPDGSRIAYISSLRGRPCRIVVRPVPAGPPLEVGRCRTNVGSRVSWAPDGWFYFVDRDRPDDPPQIVALQPTSSRRLVITRPPAVGAGDLEPEVSPDGRWLTFQRQTGAHGGQIVVRRLATGRERIVATGDPSGAAWTPDSRAVVVTAATPGAWTLWAYPISGGAPQRLHQSFQMLGRVAVGRTGLMVVEVDMTRQNLVRPPRAGGDGPQIVDAAGGRTAFPSFAPDGGLAMVSDRSGEYAIWTQRPGAAAHLLLGFGGYEVWGPRWSPDGGRLAYAVAGADGLRLQVLTATGAKIVDRKLPLIEVGFPAWLANGREVVLPGRDAKGWRIWKLDTAAASEPQPVSDYGWASVETDGEAVFSVRFADDGVWRIAPPPVRRVTSAPLGHVNQWTVSNGQVIYVDRSNPNRPRFVAQPVSGGLARAIADAPGINYDSTLAVDPLTHAPVYESAVVADTDISLFRLRRR